MKCYLLPFALTLNKFTRQFTLELDMNIAAIRFLILFTLIICNVLHTPALSQEMPVPVDLQYALLMKILTFNRTLMEGNSNDIVIGIAYQSAYSASRNTKDEFLKTMLDYPEKSIQGYQIKYTVIDIQKEDIDVSIKTNKVDVLYLAPIRAYDIEQIAKICRDNYTLSISGVPEYCEQGLSVGIDQKGAKPEIIINLDASRSENVDFSSQLLKLAKII